MKTFKKVSESELGVVETVEIIPAEVLPEKVYDYDFLLEQKISITVQRDEMIAIKEKELDEVNQLLVEADKLGIKSIKVNEEII